MKDKETIADELYYKISKYSDVQMYDAEGNDTSNIDEAVLFQINYGSETSPKIITFNIFDPEEMEMIFSKNLTDEMDNHEKEKWYKFVDDMRDFATTRMMAWKVHDITKSRFDKNDFDFIRKNTNYTHKDATMESRMYGTTRSSYTEQANTRLIVRHTEPVQEEKQGARSRNIKAIYIENANKERFLVPRNHMPTARALARHVANEGSISDDIGTTIVEMHDEMKALSKFTRKVRSTDNMMEGADRILEAAKSRYGKVKKTLESLQKQKGYTAFAETFERSELSEDGDFDTLRSTLTRHIYNEEFDDILPYLNRAIQEADDEAADKKSLNARGTEPVEAWLSSGEPLTLFVHDDDEQLAVHRSSDTMQKIALVLANIAQNLTPQLPDDLFQFSLNVSDTIGNGMQFFGTPEEKAKMKAEFDNKLRTAIKLVKRYLDDITKMDDNPGYKEEVRMERGAKKDRKVKESDLEMFENWVNDLTENAMKDELIDASDSIMQYAYELGNTHMDYDSFMQAAELLDDNNFDGLKELMLSMDTDPKEKLYELMMDAGPALADMVDSWADDNDEEQLDEVLPAVAAAAGGAARAVGGAAKVVAGGAKALAKGAANVAANAMSDDDEDEESLEEIAKLAGVELAEHGEASYSEEAQEWASKYPGYWAQMEELMKKDYGADAISDFAFEEFDNDMDDHDINDMVTAFCEQYGIDYDTEWDYDGEGYDRDEVYADDEPRWMESAEDITMEDDEYGFQRWEDEDDHAKAVQADNARQSKFFQDREDQPDYCPACGAYPCECDDELGDWNDKGRVSKLPQDQMESEELDDMKKLAGLK